MENNKLKIGLRVSKNTILGNAVLSIIKVSIGFFASSTAMIADGIHSFSDVITTIAVIIGLKLSSKEADKRHPYGHERIESIASLFLSAMLFVVAISIAISGIEHIISGNYSVPGVLAIWAALISIVSKELMYWYTIKYAKILNSSSLKADAWHHRSDSFSSIGSLIGIVGARIGFPFLDPLVALVISAIIIKVAYDICKQSVGQLIDESASEEIILDMRKKILNINGVKEINTLKTRQHGNKLFVDVEISVDAKLSVKEGHDIAIIIHNLIEEDSTVKHCMVHINPYLN